MVKDCSKIILLGHSGFIGSHLLEYFQQRHVHVPVLGFSSSEMDLTDFDAVTTLAPHLDEDAILIHCSAIQKWVHDDLAVFEKNILMVSNVLRLLQERQIRHLIYLSSAAVYGERVTNLNIVEETVPAPSNYYGVAKLACEQAAALLAEQQPGLALTILRPSLVYGNRNADEYYLPPGFIRRALDGECIRIWGDGEEIRDFIHIRDVCAVMDLVAERKIVGTYNLCSGGAVSYREILSQIGTQLGRAVNVEERARTRPKVSMALRNTKILAAAGPHRFISMSDAIRELITAATNTEPR